MTKKYRLKRDLPGLKAGAILKLEENKSGMYASECFDSKYAYFIVETNPDWFEPVDDEPKPYHLDKQDGALFYEAFRRSFKHIDKQINIGRPARVVIKNAKLYRNGEFVDSMDIEGDLYFEVPGEKKAGIAYC